MMITMENELIDDTDTELWVVGSKNSPFEVNFKLLCLVLVNTHFQFKGEITKNMFSRSHCKAIQQL